MKLLINYEAVKKIENDAIASFPKECSGILIGDSKTNEVTKVRQLNGGKVQIGDGENVIGFYHSHSKGGNAPTKDDMNEFKGHGEDQSYLILSVKNGKVGETHAWKGNGDNFKREGLIVIYGNDWTPDENLISIPGKSTAFAGHGKWTPDYSQLKRR